MNIEDIDAIIFDLQQKEEKGEAGKVKPEPEQTNSGQMEQNEPQQDRQKRMVEILKELHRLTPPPNNQQQQLLQEFKMDQSWDLPWEPEQRLLEPVLELAQAKKDFNTETRRILSTHLNLIGELISFHQCKKPLRRYDFNTLLTMLMQQLKSFALALPKFRSLQRADREILLSSTSKAYANYILGRYFVADGGAGEQLEWILGSDWSLFGGMALGQRFAVERTEVKFIPFKVSLPNPAVQNVKHVNFGYGCFGN